MYLKTKIEMSVCTYAEPRPCKRSGLVLFGAVKQNKICVSLIEPSTMTKYVHQDVLAASRTRFEFSLFRN